MTTSEQTSSAHFGSAIDIKRHLVKSAGIVGLTTLTSRILGLTRDIFSAKHFGTTWQWDTLVYAFMLPIFLRRVINEGALSSAATPVYSYLLEKENEAKVFHFSNQIFCLAGAGLLALVLIGALLFQALLAFHCLNPRFHLAVDPLQYLLPYLWFIL